jgi:hypothetical protein
MASMSFCGLLGFAFTDSNTGDTDGILLALLVLLLLVLLLVERVFARPNRAGKELLFHLCGCSVCAEDV